MGKRKEGSLADKIYKATKLPLTTYAEVRGLSLQSLKNGFISHRTARVLAQDGIVIAPSSSLKESQDD